MNLVPLIPQGKETYVLGAIDIETLDLSSHAVVWEIGIARVIFDRMTREEEPLEIEWKLVTVDIISQLVRGRSLSQSTYDFHERRLGDKFREFLTAPIVERKHRKMAYTSHEDTITSDVVCYSVRDALEEIRQSCLEFDEIWVNHPAFDCKILETLAEDYKESPLWSHRKIQDVSTVYPYTRAPSSEKSKSSHRGHEDAIWNLRHAIAFREGMENLVNQRQFQQFEAINDKPT
jgi:hypothetical protein